MNITRNTTRADGLTVGEALDKDAAFLRSVGFDAKDGALTYSENGDDLRDKFRRAVLNAIDGFFEDGKGWRDQDLPSLFAALDPIAERLKR